MSEDLKIKLAVDVSEAEKAAESLPGAFERQSRDKKPKMTQEERDAAAQRKAEQKHSDEILKLRQLHYARAKKLEEQAAKDSSDWVSDFTNKLGKGLNTAFNPLFLAGAALGFVGKFLYDWMSKGAENQARINATVSQTGLKATELRMAGALAKNLGSAMTEEEGQQFMVNAMNKARNYALGLSSEGALGLEKFGLGMKEKDKILSGQASYIEFLAKMADAYEKYGNTAQFEQEARSVFGEDWTKLRPQLAAGRRVLTTDILGTSGTTVGDMFNDELDINSERWIHGQGNVKNWLGGSRANQGVPSFAMASSLQAMGGGDVLSAVSRGPQEQIADNTERTADAVEDLTKVWQGNDATPAILVA